MTDDDALLAAMAAGVAKSRVLIDEARALSDASRRMLATNAAHRSLSRPRMSDDKNNRGAPDRNLIAMNEAHEVRYWTQALGITKEELEAAVAAVGNSADKVREHLGKPN